MIRMSKLYAPTLKEDPAEAEIASHKYMLKAGMIRKTASGIYTFLPLAKLVLNKIENIIREEMNKSGGQEILMPAMQPAELWHKSGRWNDYGPELMRLKDRHNRDFCLGPTHEEVITELVNNELNSYKQLPTILYQIQVKFRDEIRPRFGLMRGREFLMKDAYSFHDSQESLDETYDLMMQAYRTICSRCGLKFIEVEADSGQIGGSITTEFMALADSGEAEVAYCDCGYGIDTEINNNIDFCPKCKRKLKFARGIEVGQVFQLGDKYSKSMQVYYTDANGNQQPFLMGCYGIGVTRMMAAAIEQWHDNEGIMWDKRIAPAHVVVIPLGKDLVSLGEKIAKNLENLGIEVCLDDRDERPGFKFKDSDLIGWPYQLVIGKKSLEKGCVEFKNRRSKNKEEIKLEMIEDEIQSIIMR